MRHSLPGLVALGLLASLAAVAQETIRFTTRTRWRTRTEVSEDWIRGVNFSGTSTRDTA